VKFCEKLLTVSTKGVYLTMAEIKCGIVKTIGILSTSSKGWNKELNLISWNGRRVWILFIGMLFLDYGA